MTSKRFLLLSFYFGLALPAAVSAQSRVIVMAPAPSRDAIIGALRVELASRRTEVVATEAPLGDSRLTRAASAQASARVAGADAAVWTDLVDEGGGPVTVVRVAPATDGDVRQAPLPAGADARAIAVVAASLLTELLGPPDLPPPAPVDVDVHATVDVHVHLPASAPVSDAPTALAMPTPVLSPKDNATTIYGSLALGGTMFVNDAALDPGMLVRGSVGVRLARAVRLGLDTDLIGVFEQGTERAFRPTLRVGPSIELEVPIGELTLRFGLHVRAALSNTWQYLPTGAGTLAAATVAWGVTAGGSIGLSIPLRAGLALDVGLEVDGMARDVSGRTPWVAPALLVGLTWT